LSSPPAIAKGKPFLHLGHRATNPSGWGSGILMSAPQEGQVIFRTAMVQLLPQAMMQINSKHFKTQTRFEFSLFCHLILLGFRNLNFGFVKAPCFPGPRRFYAG
jgi:hypothetical protein